MTYELWEQFLDLRPDIRKRVERQTPWRNTKTAVGIGHIFTTLSGRIHAGQEGDAAVVISKKFLTKEECLGIGAVLLGYVPIQFEPAKLWDEFKKNEEAAN